MQVLRRDRSHYFFNGIWTRHNASNPAFSRTHRRLVSNTIDISYVFLLEDSGHTLGEKVGPQNKSEPQEISYTIEGFHNVFFFIRGSGLWEA